jgi:signal peptidase II
MNRKISVMPESSRWYALAFLVIVTDQTTKGLSAYAMAYGEAIRVTEFFNLVHFRNDGAAFSFLAGSGHWSRIGLILIALGFSVWIARVLRQPSGRAEALGYSLILGGALGNVLDRILRGSVVDFLDVHWRDVHWPAFNLADVAIFAGVVCLIVSTLSQVRPVGSGGRVG